MKALLKTTAILATATIGLGIAGCSTYGDGYGGYRGYGAGPSYYSSRVGAYGLGVGQAAPRYYSGPGYYNGPRHVDRFRSNHGAGRGRY